MKLLLVRGFSNFSTSHYIAGEDRLPFIRQARAPPASSQPPSVNNTALTLFSADEALALLADTSAALTSRSSAASLRPDVECRGHVTEATRSPLATEIRDSVRRLGFFESFDETPVCTMGQKNKWKRDLRREWRRVFSRVSPLTAEDLLFLHFFFYFIFISVVRIRLFIYLGGREDATTSGTSKTARFIGRRARKSAGNNAPVTKRSRVYNKTTLRRRPLPARSHHSRSIFFLYVFSHTFWVCRKE